MDTYYNPITPKAQHLSPWLTDCIGRYAQADSVAPIRIIQGTSNVPGLCFQNNTKTGFFDFEGYIGCALFGRDPWKLGQPIYGETPVGSGVSYTLQFAPTNGVAMFLNGSRVTNFTYTGNIITFGSAPSGTLVADYHA